MIAIGEDGEAIVLLSDAPAAAVAGLLTLRMTEDQARGVVAQLEHLLGAREMRRGGEVIPIAKLRQSAEEFASAAEEAAARDAAEIRRREAEEAAEAAREARRLKKVGA